MNHYRPAVLLSIAFKSGRVILKFIMLFIGFKNQAGGTGRLMADNFSGKPSNKTLPGRKKHLKSIGILAIVSSAALITGLVVIWQSRENPLIYQFSGAFYFVGLDDENYGIQPLITGIYEEYVYSRVLPVDWTQNFSAAAIGYRYYARTVESDLGKDEKVPRSSDIKYTMITVNTSQLCAWAIVDRISISNDTLTLHRFCGAEIMGKIPKRTTEYDPSYTSFTSTRNGYSFVAIDGIIYSEHNGTDTNRVLPHSISGTLNITYTKSFEFFVENAGHPILLFSVEIPIIEVFISGPDHAMKVTEFCSYYSIKDVADNYSAFSHPDYYVPISQTDVYENRVV